MDIKLRDNDNIFFTAVAHGAIYYHSFGVWLGSPNANHVMGWLHVPAGERACQLHRHEWQ